MAAASAHNQDCNELTPSEHEGGINRAPALGRGSSLLHTGCARSFGDEQYLALLLAGSLLQVALILVGVTVGATDGHVVIVALGRDTEQQR